VKKLISIGVAVALLAMVVLPVAVAADYTPPQTYAKVPFAIVQSGFELLGDLLTALGGDLGLPSYLNESLMNTIGGWAGGPLSWSVDMLAWGLELGSEIWTLVDTTFGIGYPAIGQILTITSCKLMTCWSASNCSGYLPACNIT
jgi:hypothetical protein